MTTKIAFRRIDTSLIFQNIKKEGVDVPNLKHLREKAGMTVFELAAASDVSISTVNRLERGTVPVSRRLVYKVLNTLSERLGTAIDIKDVDNLSSKDD